MTYQPTMFELTLTIGTRAVTDDLTAHSITFDEHGATVTCVDQAEVNEWLLVMTGLTVSGFACWSSRTSEQVASKPMPLTASGGSAASAIAARTEVTHAAQMSGEDCSTISPASRQTAIGCRAVASKVPLSSNTPARALPVPTSTPMKACRMGTPLRR